MKYHFLLKYSKCTLMMSHTYNFSYSYVFVLILILYSYYSYSKFELIFNNKHDVVDFGSPWIDIYRTHKICMIPIRTLQYSLEDCVFALLAVFMFSLPFFFVNATTTKTVNFDEWFESLESFMSVFTFQNLWIRMSSRMSLMLTLYS